MTAQIPMNETERIEALRQYQILDTIPEDSYDDITLLASQICETPIAAMSLIDSERQWFKSKVGFQISETSRGVAFCAHTILTPDLLIVPNTADDERFANNPLVTGDPWIRFYAGAPLITPTGESLGSLCVVDKVQRTLTDTQTSSLRALSRQLMSQLELRRLLYLQEKNQRVLEDYQRTLEETNQKLMIQSLTDDVTGFHNTRFLHQYLDKMVDELKQMSLVFFDMDDFKTVVDTHGHLIGAEVLREVAKVVNQNLDTQDRIIRYGGDEFVVILPNQGRSRAFSKAERMKEAISSTLFIFEGNIQIKVTASFGLAVFPDDAKDRKQLLLEADQCLFQSKQEGKNRISSKSNLSKRS